MHLVVLIRGHVEKRAAVLAGVARRTGIRADQESLGVGDRLVDRLQDVGEDRPDHEIDLVALEQSLDLAHRAVGFKLIIGDHDFDVASTHLAAEILDREIETVADLLTERGGGTRQRNDDADLQLLLRAGRRCRDAERERQRCASKNMCHRLLPLRKRRRTVRARLARRKLSG